MMDALQPSPHPTLSDLQAAAERIAPYAFETPLLEFAGLNDLLEGRILLKAENLQRTGSFKFRGACNKIMLHDTTRFSGGVVGQSSGNHAQGVAESARLRGIPAAVAMPSDAPAIKIDRTRRSGADVVLYDRDRDDRVKLAKELAASRDAEFVHPFDDFDIVCGQGTCGLEIVDQAAELGAEIDQVLVCCSGGGLSSGIALAISELVPGASLHTVEPAGFNDFQRSLASGEIVSNAEKSGSVCDALLSPHPGTLTFEIARDLIDSGLAVTDEQALGAVAFAFRELKLVLEPGGAVAFAAALSGVADVRGRTTVCVLSGGNVTPEVYARALAADAA